MTAALHAVGAPADRSAPLRVVASPAIAARLRGHREIGTRVLLSVGSGWLGVLRAARLGGAEVAVVDAAEPRARLQAILLRAAGITVWWVDGGGGRCPGAGAPGVSTTAVDVEGLEQAAEAAARPGAGLLPDRPLSVVITTLDEGVELDRVVAAVAAQLSTGDELVVVDGGSTDGSVERVTAQWQADTRIALHRIPGTGISAGRNTGVRLASHDVIICTDAGCELAPGWVDGMRRAFAGEDPPGLVSGPYRPRGDDSMSRAQAWACYPDPQEVARPDLAVRLYTRVFGTGFDPRYSIGRNVGFTRAAWSAAGGFPEHLPTGEDVSFGLAVARTHRCVGAADALVTWQQRPDLSATWRMYRSYGRASTDGGDVRLLARDAVRGAGYALGVTLALSGRRGRRTALAGAACYLSLPVRRAARGGAHLGDYPLVPVALATKDLGKLAGAVQGLARARARARGSRT